MIPKLDPVDGLWKWISFAVDNIFFLDFQIPFCQPPDVDVRAIFSTLCVAPSSKMERRFVDQNLVDVSATFLLHLSSNRRQYGGWMNLAMNKKL